MTSRNKHSRESVENAAWIEPYRKAYLEKLVTQGYSAFTIIRYQRNINRFCEKLKNRTPEIQKADGFEIEALLQSVLSRIHKNVRVYARLQLGRFIDFLVDAGAVPLPEPLGKGDTAMDRLRAEYGNYLHIQRGLSEATIDHCLRIFERFMIFRFGDGLGDLNTITPDDSVSFLVQLRVRSKTRPYRYGSLPSYLRSLFNFLFWSGKTGRDLASSIPRIARPQPTSLPRYLKPEEVQRLIDAARSNDAIGCRDYAIMLLLARLGLRAVEVVAIQLEDIDWRAGEILIRGKGKLHDRMPLPGDVGEAIVNYIKNSRVSNSRIRTLFVSANAPHEALKDPHMINAVVNRAFEKSGLKQRQKYVGTHLLRHSLATALLGKGGSMEEISHVLRHRSLTTTMIYAKYDMGALRSIAQPWPVEGGVL